MGRHLDAARALERSGADGSETVSLIQSYLYQHLSASAPGDKKAVEALYREAIRMKEQGNLIPALARFRLLGDAENVQDICLRLGRHEEALRYFLTSDKVEEAKRYAASSGVTVSAGFVESFVQERWQGRAPASIDDRQVVEVTFLMLAASVRGADISVARPLVETVVDAVFGTWINEELLPRAAFDMLIEHRVGNVIMGILAFRRRLGLPASLELRMLIDSLSRAARETGDPDLAACAAFGAGDIEEFERLAAGRELTDANAVVLAESQTRYPEAVARLMASDWIDQAEAACFRRNDHARAGRYAEERGEMDDAVRWYVDGRDYASALRCALAAGNERAAARAYEHLDRFDDAIEAWTRLGKTREAERVRKKMEKQILPG
jgi:tetratricopeptide (TPR) repeat protein